MQMGALELISIVSTYVNARDYSTLSLESTNIILHFVRIHELVIVINQAKEKPSWVLETATEKYLNPDKLLIIFPQAYIHISNKPIV